jgi:hypothetical protein
MASKRNRTINMPAPYLKRVWLEPSRITDRAAIRFACRCCATISN